jgi:hypothetical protein
LPATNEVSSGLARQAQKLIAEAAVTFEQQLLEARVEVGYAGGAQEFDRILPVEGLVMDVGLALGWTVEIVLGERRTLVGALGPVTDQEQPTVEALFTKGFCRLGPGEAGRRRSRMSEVRLSSDPFAGCNQAGGSCGALFMRRAARCSYFARFPVVSVP